MDFLRPGLKTGVGNGIFWSEIGSGFGDTGSTPPPKISKSTPPPPWGHSQLRYQGDLGWALSYGKRYINYF